MAESEPLDPCPMPAAEGQGMALRHSRADLRLAKKAIREGWPVVPGNRQRVVDMADEMVSDDGFKPSLRIAAAKVLILCDAVNVRRERNALDERTAEDRLAAGAMKDLLRSPEARAALAALTGQLCTAEDLEALNRDPGLQPPGGCTEQTGPAQPPA